jgi:hypothetical protein
MHSRACFIILPKGTFPLWKFIAKMESSLLSPLKCNPEATSGPGCLLQGYPHWTNHKNSLHDLILYVPKVDNDHHETMYITYIVIPAFDNKSVPAPGHSISANELSPINSLPYLCSPDRPGVTGACSCVPHMAILFSIPSPLLKILLCTVLWLWHLLQGCLSMIVST